MKIVQQKDKFQITVTRDELLELVNGLGARALLIREIGSLLNPGDKKRQKELDKLHRALAEALWAEAQVDK